MRPHQHHHVGKTVDHQTEIGLWPALPFILEADAAGAAEVDLVEGAGDGVESGREDNDVELVCPPSGLDAIGRDPLDRRLVKVDQLDIVLVVDLVIEGLERQPAGAKAVIAGDQFFRGVGILDALANLSRTPGGVLTLHVPGVVRHLERQLERVVKRAAASVGQPLHATFLVAFKDLVAGLTGDPKLSAKFRHRLAGDLRTAVFDPSPNTPSMAYSLPPPREKVLPMCPVRCVTYIF